MSLLALVAAPAVVAAAPARTDEPPPPIDPDPRAVAEASEANLVPESVREGFAFGIAVGPAVQLGYGVRDATGKGPGVNLRFGTVASPSLIWLVEISTTAYQKEDDDGTQHINQSAVATFGAQIYVKEAFWIRGGAGFATFTRRSGDAETGSFGGLGASGAGGFDLLRRRGLALSIEGMGSLAFYESGTVLGVAVQTGLSWY